ncbi:MAG: putative transcriptional regulator, Crp/Fnr family [Verrucomicrobiaceae bacterium]|nr:putative transcriptional regulator, Crp/Fnr family [Verrucomicrobiaceae bacterium]
MKEFAYIHEEGTLPEALQSVPFLNSFTDEQLDEVLSSSSFLQCEVGDAIIKEGTIDSRIYILLSGQLEVRVGGKTVASISHVGDVFGELALVNHDKRLASVVAASKAICLAVDQKFLQDIHPREEDPDFHAALYQFVARLVAKKLDATSRRLAEVEKELRLLKEAATDAEPAPVKTLKAPRISLKKPKSLPKKKVVAKASRIPASRPLARKR